MIGYIALAFGSIQSKADIKEFKKAYFEKKFFKNFSFFRKSKDKPFEEIEDNLKESLAKVLPKVEIFDLYLPHSHKKLLQNLNDPEVEKWAVFTLCPIFNPKMVMKGAKFFNDNLEKKLLNKIFWITINKNSSFVSFYQKKLKEFLSQNNLLQKETVLLFTSTLENGAEYNQSVNELTKEILKSFPYILGKNIFSLEEIQIEDFEERKNVIFVSLSSLTLTYENFILEKNVFPLIKNKGLNPFSFKYVFEKDFEELLLELMDKKLTPNSHFINENQK